MDGFERFGVFGCDADAPAAFDLLVLVLDLFFQTLHDGHAGRGSIVDEHRRIEIAGGEHLCDMAQMLSDLVLTGRILFVVGRDFDYAAIAREAEIVRRLLVRESHRLIAALIDTSRVLGVRHIRCGTRRSIRGDAITAIP